MFHFYTEYDFTDGYFQTLLKLYTYEPNNEALSSTGI